MEQAHTLFKLVYVSDKVQSKPCDIDFLVRDAAAFNLSVNVTGALWFDGKQFVQILEGTKEALGQVFERITVSESHTSMTLVCFEEINSRTYKDWYMASLGGDGTSREIAAKFVGHHEFTLRELPTNTLIELLVGLETERQYGVL